MQDDTKQFEMERKERVRKLGENKELRDISKKFLQHSLKERYSYNFDWLGIPIIQHPEDIVGMQEIVWRLKPDCIIETGVARGGSIIFYASLLELIGKGKVIGIDIDIREHNKKRIEAHPMMKRIRLIEGSSVEERVIREVQKEVKGTKTVLVVLDSLHTHAHVLAELKLYAPLVTKGSYIVVFDTVIEDMPKGMTPDRPWDKGNNPATAVKEFLKTTDAFELDKEIEHKLLITAAPNGFLKRVG